MPAAPRGPREFGYQFTRSLQYTIRLRSTHSSLPAPSPPPLRSGLEKSAVPTRGAARTQRTLRVTRSLALAFSPRRAMLRVIVESASNIPKTKFGKPDPIVSVIFKGKEEFSSFSQVLLWNVSFVGHVL